MKKIFIICFSTAFILLLLIYGQLIKLQKKESPAVIINNFRIIVEIADSQREQMQGLSGRKILPDNTGMLFLYSSPKVQTFWMKNMRFPLDIIWIDQYKIVGFKESVPAEGEYPQNRYYSPLPVDKVLELNAGMVKKLDIQNGQTVKLDNIP